MKKQNSKQNEVEVLAVAARGGDQKAVDDLCHRFSRFIYKLSQASYGGLDREDTAQDLWVCFLTLIRTYDPGEGLPFLPKAVTMLRWKAADIGRAYGKYAKWEGGLGSDTTDKLLSGDMMLSGPRQNWESMEDRPMAAADFQHILREAGMTDRQRVLLQEYLAGKSWHEIALSHRVSDAAVYKTRKKIQKAFLNSPAFCETFL